MTLMNGSALYNNNNKKKNLEISICDPLKDRMDEFMLIVSICMGKSIRMKVVKELSGLPETRIVRE